MGFTTPPPTPPPEDVEEFDGFQVKISLLNHSQPYIPRISDFRGIALA